MDPEEYKIHGTITDAAGQELSYAEVTVWWQRIRKRLPLATGHTSEEGHYHLSYRPPDDAPGKLLIVVEVRSEHLHTPLESPLTTAQPDLQIDLSVQPRDQSEFSTLLRSIIPLLNGLSLLDIVENDEHQDISFLAQETGNSKEQIMRVVVADRLQAAYDISAAAFYAFLRLGVPSALPSPLLEASQSFTLIEPLVHRIGSLIFALTTDVQKLTLETAVQQQLVNQRLAEQIPAILEAFQSLHSTDVLQLPYHVGKTTLGQLLDVAQIDKSKQQAFAQALTNNTQSMRNLWKTLGDGQHGFTKAEVLSIQQTLEVGAFVKNHLPLVQVLLQRYTTDNSTSLASLARLSIQDWEQLVRQTGAPNNIYATSVIGPEEAFAREIYARFTRAYPTVALSSRVAEANLVPQTQQQPLLQFFQNNPNLELVKDNIPAFLAREGDKAFEGISEEDRPAVIANARSFQRVLRVASSTDGAQNLLVQGIHSATQITTMGQQQFFLKATAAGLTKLEANQVYQLAAHRYASVVALYMKLNIDAVGVWPHALGDLADLNQATQEAIQRDQSLATLFGSQDYCAIDDCTSILSPAAYLCDLLLWLRNHQQGKHTALDVLDGRRPDIRHLLLNCPNTDTELPYIDLVNELLADKISPPTDPKSTINPIWKQTSEDLTVAQLNAAPQYFNQDAYVKLFGASYPQTLPYSAGLDELRTYLKQLKLPLWQLRQALLPVGGASVAQQAAVAAERLGMNVQAESLVTTTNFVPAPVAWNTSDFSATAPNGLATVPVFLHASSLSYESLLELLDVNWVQNGLGIHIVGLNDTCATSSMTLSPAAPQLDPGFLDRAHRFLRLWFATGYKMWELDLLLLAPKVGNGVLDQQALVRLQSFWQLQNAIGLSVDQLLAFYQKIDTATHREPDSSTTTSLYAQIFLNPTVTWVAPDPDLVILPGGGTIGDTVLSHHLKALQPALGISGANATALFALTDNKLTLDNLSLMYRVKALAQASKYSITNLLNVAALLNPTAPTPAAAVATLFASPATTLAFLTQATNVQTSGLSLDALTYLLTPPTSTTFAAITTLTAAITATQTTITVASNAGFPMPSFYIHIGAEILQVTAVGGVGNTTWTVLRGQQGTVASSASNGAAVTPAGSGGWTTTTQMTPVNISTTLAAVQQATVQLLSASTTLTAAITATQTTITVASDAGFPSPNFYIYIGTEILKVIAIGGTGNTTWTVLRGQQGTVASSATAGASVTPTIGDLDGSVIAAVAGNAYPSGGIPLANDVSALILKTLQVPGVGKTLLAVLEDPALVAPTGTITIGGTPTAGDTLTTVITDISGNTVAVLYTLTGTDAGDVNQTAADFAQAINASSAVAGPNAFLAPCMAAGAVVTLTALTPGAPGSNITCMNTAQSGVSNISVTPDTTVLNGVPTTTQANFPNQFLAIQLFDKVGVLIRRLKLVAVNLSWLLTHASVYGGLDLSQLPVTSSQAALSLSPLLTTLLLIKLSRLFTAAPPASPVQTLYDIIGGVSSGTLATGAQVQVALATISGWPLADIEAFAPALGLAYPASYTQPAVYDALRTLEAMAKAVSATGSIAATASTTLTAAITAAQTTIPVTSAIGFPSPNFYITIGSEILLVTAFGGADNTTWTVLRSQMGTAAAPAASGTTVTATYGAQIVNWGSVPANEISAENLASSALGVLKAQQPTDAVWLDLAPKLMDPIRDRRSAALQAYLISLRDGSGNLIYGDASGLFDYFLIDVQMSSCQVTSRIVQAYIAVQIFVERCLMNLETTLWGSSAPGVVVDLAQDDTWNQWKWMSRYRVWEANREVFLYPENWLIESQRPNRTEIYQKFEQEVHQGQSTADYLETVVLNYIDRLDGVAHLQVTGTCEDPKTGTIYVVASTLADPPVFYLRSLTKGAWTGWTQIPLDIKAHQVVPALYRGRVCLFWPDVKVSNEPEQKLPAPMASGTPPKQGVERYVTLGIHFSIFRNGSWAPVQASKGKLFDKPLLNSSTASDIMTVEALYTLKVQTPVPAPGYGANLYVDVFRFNDYNVVDIAIAEDFEDVAANLAAQAAQEGGSLGAATASLAAVFAKQAATLEAAASSTKAVHVGRAVFDGRFNDLELNNLSIAIHGNLLSLYPYAKSTYGPDAQPLLPLTVPDPDLTGELGLVPQAGALSAFPDGNPGSSQTIQLNFKPADSLELNVGPLLNTAPLPFRVVGPVTSLGFDPSSYFFFQDNQRSYYVESPKFYWTGSYFTSVVPSYPNSVPYELMYRFHPFYHPFTRLFWNQLAGGGFDLLYDPRLQQAPDSIDPSYSDVFSFQNFYQPTWRVQWDLADASTTLALPIDTTQTFITVTSDIWVPSPTFYAYIGNELVQVTAVGGTNNTQWSVARGQQGTTAASAASGAAVIPTTSSQDRQFLDFSYGATFSVYNWELFYHIPLYVAQLLSRNQQFEDALAWFHYIFNPTRQGSDPVPQRFWIPKPLHNLTGPQILQQQINNLLKAVNQQDTSAVAEIQNWRKDPFNPFLLADMRNVAYMKSTVMSYLDNLIAWGDNLFSTESREALSEATLIYVIASEILGPKPQAVPPPQHADQSFDQLEPSLDAFANAMVEIENVIGGGAGGAGGGAGGGIPGPQTFYFKIPPNETLLGYWGKVDDRLYKLRHCQNIAGAPLQLALFDAPIDPGLLIAAQAAGVDLSSVLSNLNASLPNYRFTALYSQALDFVNAVRAYGSSLQAALEKSDAGALALLQQTTQQQLLADGNQILDWQVQQAQSNIDALNQALALAQSKYNFNHGQDRMNAGEDVELALNLAIIVNYLVVALGEGIASIAALIPDFSFGAAGFGGSPSALVKLGGENYHATSTAGANVGKAVAAAVDKSALLAGKQGSYDHRKDAWDQAAAEAQIQIQQTNIQLAGAQLVLQIAQQNQTLHQEQIDNLQKQIDFLNDKFTSNSLYDWMVGSLSATYFQSYQLAYQMCKKLERCYQFELGIQNSSFIQFGYWDSLYKGLLAGETLNHDLRRIQASYLQENARRYELSRYVSLGSLNPATLQSLLVNGFCDFDLPEALFDGDYPGHYNRRLTRVSMTVVYPNPGKFDNVKATLTLVSNKVRVKTDTSSGYVENPVGSDPRFLYNFAANSQKIAMGNAQDDPGLFVTAIASNIADQRYLPFENAGAISSWHLEMPQLNNEVDLSTIGDIMIHLYYTALDGGIEFQQTVQQYNIDNLPSNGIKIFSAQNDFAAAWQTFLTGTPQKLTLAISSSKFPAWTRGKTISVTSLTVLAIAWEPGNFVLAPQAPLPTTQVTMPPVAGVTEPNICSATVALPAGTPLGTWSFELQQQGAADFQSLTKDLIGDVMLLVSYEVS